MPVFEEPQQLDLISVQRRVDELKQLHKFLSIEFEVRQQPSLENPMLRRLKDVLRHDSPEGISPELWEETLKYYGEQRTFSNVLQWVRARVDQYTRILKEIEPPKAAPDPPTAEEVKQHTKAVIAVLTKVTKTDIMQHMDPSMPESRLN